MALVRRTLDIDIQVVEGLPVESGRSVRAICESASHHRQRNRTTPQGTVGRDGLVVVVYVRDREMELVSARVEGNLAVEGL